jgi:hypothetical protein
VLLGSLPPEVWKRILDYLILFDGGQYGIWGQKHKQALSRVSRVCRELASTLRPLLFKRLGLGDSSDVSFLWRIILLPVSMCLALHVQHIYLFQYQGGMPSAVALFSHLSSV